MITLTAPNGKPVGDYDNRAQTVLIVGGQHQAVVETMDEINKLIAG